MIKREVYFLFVIRSKYIGNAVHCAQNQCYQFDTVRHEWVSLKFSLDTSGLEITDCLGTLSGVYNHWKQATTAAFSDFVGSMFDKNIDAPGWERSSTRKS